MRTAVTLLCSSVLIALALVGSETVFCISEDDLLRRKYAMLMAYPGTTGSFDLRAMESEYPELIGISDVEPQPLLHEERHAVELR